jgi:hypothetical protein
MRLLVAPQVVKKWQAFSHCDVRRMTSVLGHVVVDMTEVAAAKGKSASYGGFQRSYFNEASGEKVLMDFVEFSHSGAKLSRVVAEWRAQDAAGRSCCAFFGGLPRNRNPRQ